MASTTTIISSSSVQAVFTTIIPSLKTQPSLPYSSSCKFGANLIASNENLALATAATEAVALANAAVEAAREAVALVTVISGESGNDLVDRRKKRRRRRKGFVQCFEVENLSNSQCVRTLFEPLNDNNKYLSSVEVADFCLYLKDQARLEAARTRIAETQQHEPTLKQLAKDLSIRKMTVDKIICKGKQSRARITHNYKRLVVSIANRYRGKGLSIEDLIQEGNIGLLRGAERFDPRKGTKLSTYVYWWIKEAIITSISNKSRVVRVPVSLWENMTKIAEVKNSLRKRLGRFPSDNEIAEELNVQISTVRLAFMRTRSPLSLDREVSDQGGMTLQEIIPGPEEMIPENMVNKQLMKQELEEIIQTLSEREASILKSIFGFNGQTPQSCDEIGRSLKLCRERIRQINSTALSKLRQKHIVDRLKMYIYSIG